MSASIAFGTGKVPEDLTTYGAWARQVESSGFSMVVAGDSQSLWADPFLTLSVAANHTDKALLATTADTPEPAPNRANKPSAVSPQTPPTRDCHRTGKPPAQCDRPPPSQPPLSANGLSCLSGFAFLVSNGRSQVWRWKVRWRSQA